MPNRRDFFRTVAGAAAGAIAGSSGMAVVQGRQGGRGEAGAGPTGPVVRRQVSINGKRVKVIDIHAHVTVPEVNPIVAGTPYERQGGGRSLDQERINALDRQGIDVQVLSINGFWWYAIADRDLAGRIVRAQNEGLAKIVSTRSDRFQAMASTSLQFPDLAAQQLDEGVKKLGLRAAAIGGHVNGEDLSNPKYDPFWAKASELDVMVFMHPDGAENILKEGVMRGRGDLGNIIGNPLETTYLLERMIYDGTFDKFPGLKLGCAHAAGYLPSYLGRAEVACDVRVLAMCANKKKPSEYLKTQVFADTMILSDEGLRHLVAEMGPSQIVYGTDNPLNWPVTIDLVLNAKFLTDAEKELILGGNLQRLLKMTS